MGDYVERVRQKLLGFAHRFGIESRARPLDVRHSLTVQATMAAITVDEMRSKSLRGYGPIDEETREAIERDCDDLEHALQQFERAIATRRESVEERIARLEDVPFDTRLLEEMARIIRAYGFVEFRPALQSLVGRLEERTFNIALFGRVSAGKSSLLNALIGAPLLPVGVTPITAVPTRVRSGPSPHIVVRVGDEPARELPLEELPEFASEERNPQNRKRVSRLDVVCPSPRLAGGVEFVDTPGIGALATQGASETFAYLPRADVAVLLIDIGSAVGSDELMLLRLLFDAAIPVRIALSKGDLVDAQSRDRMQRYVVEGLRKELGVTCSVSVVSSVPEGALLLDAWLKSEIEPLLAESGHRRQESINRIGGALRENLERRLQIEIRGLRQQIGGATESAGEARAQVRRIQERFHGIADRLVAEWSGVLDDAADEVAASWKTHRKPVPTRPILSRLLHEAMLQVRREFASEFGNLKTTLLSASGEDERVHQLLRASWPSQELEGFPILDSAGILPEVALPPPVISAAGLARRRALEALQQRCEGAISAPLRSYGMRLRKWGLHRIEQFEGPFLNAIDAGAASAVRNAPEAAQIDQDIAALESFGMVEKGVD